MQEFEIDGHVFRIEQTKKAWVFSVMIDGKTTNPAVIRDGEMHRHLPAGWIGVVSKKLIFCRIDSGTEETCWLDESACMVNEKEKASPALAPSQDYFPCHVDFTKHYLREDELILAIAANLLNKKGLIFLDKNNNRIKFLPLDYIATPSHDGGTFLLRKQNDGKTQLLIIDNPLLD